MEDYSNDTEVEFYSSDSEENWWENKLILIFMNSYIKKHILNALKSINPNFDENQMVLNL